MVTWYPVTMLVSRRDAKRNTKRIRRQGAHAKIKKITRYTDATLRRKKTSYMVYAHD